MKHYEFNLSDCDEEKIPKINRLISRSNGSYKMTETKDGCYYFTEFESDEHLNSFKIELAKIIAI